MDHLSHKNPFASHDIPTMDAVLKQIEMDYQVPHQRRHDLCSAIRKMETLFGRPLSMIPASADFLRRLFEGTNHITLELSERRLQNIRSLIMAAFRHVRMSTSLAPYRRISFATRRQKSFSTRNPAITKLSARCSATRTSPRPTSTMPAPKPSPRSIYMIQSSSISKKAGRLPLMFPGRTWPSKPSSIPSTPLAMVIGDDPAKTFLAEGPMAGD